MPRHIIVSHGRSGSNYFAQLLNQHKNAVNFGEVLGDWTLSARLFLKHFAKNGGSEKYLDWIYSSDAYFYGAQSYSFGRRLRSTEKTHFRRKTKHTSIGIKEFYINFKDQSLLTYVHDREDIKIIFLVRDNILQRYLSGCHIGKTGIIKTTNSSLIESYEKIKIDIEEMKQCLTVYQREHDELENMLETIPSNRILKIVFEDYFYADEKSKKITQNSMFDFLGLDRFDLQDEHKQIRPHDIAKAVENYEEVDAALASGPFHHLLS